jgi:hypothetical protein
MINNEIPYGPYCYDENGLCKHWKYIEKYNGQCNFLNKSDNNLETGLLWDQVKECNINWSEDE